MATLAGGHAMQCTTHGSPTITSHLLPDTGTTPVQYRGCPVAVSICTTPRSVLRCDSVLLACGQQRPKLQLPTTHKCTHKLAHANMSGIVAFVKEPVVAMVLVAFALFAILYFATQSKPAGGWLSWGCASLATGRTCHQPT
jgi:hypothetical protein